VVGKEANMRLRIVLFLLLLIVGVGCAAKVAGPGRGRFLEVGDKATLILVDPSGAELVMECTQEEDALRCASISP